MFADVIEFAQEKLKHEKPKLSLFSNIELINLASRKTLIVIFG